MGETIAGVFDDIESAIVYGIEKIDIPDGVVYACGFWLFYCDYTILGTPCFAYNIEGNEKDSKWCPPEWIVDVSDEVTAEIQPIYNHLSESLDGSDDDTWEQMILYQWERYVKFCKKLNEHKCFNRWKLSADFVVGIFEEREEDEIYEALVRSSIGKEKAESLGII